ncbi:MAG: hypothetical protein M3Z06_04395, partial [Actinomycetota bacterium]|nr:hypothetical protein [Actinomycetota bacterium]
MNDDAETLGVADDEPLAPVDEPAEPEDELELEDELPHAATVKLATTASAAKTALLLSRRTLTSLSLRDNRNGHTTSAQRLTGCHSDRIWCRL